MMRTFVCDWSLRHGGKKQKKTFLKESNRLLRILIHQRFEKLYEFSQIIERPMDAIFIIIGSE